MRHINANLRSWAAGTVTAFAGVALARLAAPALPESSRAFAAVGGQLVALAGLLIICLGVRARVRQAAPRERTIASLNPET